MSDWAVFLDRDGVLTEPALSPSRASEMRVVDGAADAVDALKSAGALVVVVTNQPDVARGNLTRAELSLMNDRLYSALAVDEIVACPHTGDDCTCRKPKPGMLLDAADRYGLDLHESWMVGDRWVDIAAGLGAGTATVLVDRPYSWQPTSAGRPAGSLRADFSVPQIGDAAVLIVDSRQLVPAAEVTE
jgi:D-glycero-D-manno-heptose 1,7-bisphosphate phosphatase